MKTINANNFWNKKAAFFASKERQKKTRQVEKLYENACWQSVEPVLPSIDDSIILEAGCGTGRWVFRLAPMGYQIELLDFSQEMIKYARKAVEEKGLNDYVTGYHVLDICDMNHLISEKFDLILALGNPISLCSNPEKAIEELSRITKPGGYVVCDVINKYRSALDLASKNDFSQFFEVLYNGRMITESGQTHYRFGPEELEDLFLKKGFSSFQIIALCPFFDVPASKNHVALLDDDEMFNAIQKSFNDFAKDPNVIALSSRHLIVAQKKVTKG